jgi:hypothetical protein
MKRHERLAGIARQNVNDFLNELGKPMPRPLVTGAISRIEERIENGEGESLQSVIGLSHSAQRHSSHRSWTAWITGLVVAGFAISALLLPPPLNFSVVAKAESEGLYIASLQKLVSKGFEIEAGQAVRSGADGASVELTDRSRIE